ncbi:MAG: glycoside hydrolase family 130 protein [Planctomycetota bacterium]|jgi:predicted GH43/DUF377 family glycosyl hydrolase
MPELAMQVMRSTVTLNPDPARVIARPFIPGGPERLQAMFDRICGMGDQQAHEAWQGILADFAGRHKDLPSIFRRHYQDAARIINSPAIEESRQLLIGAFLTMEYSLESVALFNPSIVPHPQQTGAGARVVISLRACGEEHVSSIELREGTIDDNGDMRIDPLTPYAMTERPQKHRSIDKNVFYLKLVEMGGYDSLADRVLNRLGDRFTLEELERTLESLQWTHNYVERFHDLAETMLWLGRSSYRLDFPEDSVISERVVFPVTENESRGIEDARFVKFTDDDGSSTYYATYTAYNGFRTLPQLLETPDFRQFNVHTLNGSCVQNKGMALFPRKVRGSYMMLARLDGVHIYALRSEHLFFWNESQRIYGPTFPWEFVQLGNCGSPIELEQGWLVLTHGVGPMRQYAMGAMLLDLEDPSRILGVLDQPLLSPDPDERDGYVPNVVYSCGGLVHGGRLIIPYAVADSYTRIASVDVNELLDSIVPVPRG